MKRPLLSLLCVLALMGGAFAQTAADPNEGSRLTRDGLDSYAFSFWGKAGRFYFVQYSEDLVHWFYFPHAYAPGEDAPNAYGFHVSGADRFFVRLKYLPSYTGDPASQDPDGDKVTTQDELAGGTNPFHSIDSDGDGIPDDWEFRFGLDPDDPADAAADPDDDGISNLAEYQTGSLGTDPTDHYNGTNYPTIGTVGWPDLSPTDEPDTLVPGPFVVEVRNGAIPVSNARVTVFVVGANQGQISTANDGTGLATTLYLRTGANGRTQVYYKHPSGNPPVPTLRTITAKVGSALLNGNGPVISVLPTTQHNYDYPANTVGLDMSQAVDSRISLIAPNDIASAKLVFSTQGHGTLTDPPVYVRNTASWCYDLRQHMTCISPWNSCCNVIGAGTAITPQHIINAAHVALPVGVTIRFITANNQVIDKTIRGRAIHPGYATNTQINDIAVYTLDSPLPTTITPCKLLPANYANHLSYLENGRPPAMLLDQEEKALVWELNSLNSFTNFVPPGLHKKQFEFWENIVNGDSGNPSFLIINNSLVLASTHTSVLSPFLTPQISIITPARISSDIFMLLRRNERAQLGSRPRPVPEIY